MKEEFYIERVVRIAAGSFVMISLLLAHFHSPLWLWFTGFVGLNLFQSGFTQFCPMFNILQKMGVPRFPKNTCLMLLMVVAVASPVWAAEKDISAREAKALLDGNKNIYLLDVRTPQEYSQGRIAGSVLIPTGEFERRVRDVPRNKTIVVYCAVGSRSKSVAGFLARQGYREVYNMTDGIVGWYRNGFPVLR